MRLQKQPFRTVIARPTRPRKIVLFTTSVVAALAAATYAYSSGGPNTQLLQQNRVYGGGQVTVSAGDLRNFAIDAHADGATAYGDAEYAGAVHWGHEQVTCLNVRGSSATVGAIITAGDRPSTIGMAVLWVVQDNGNPLSATPDAATLQEVGPVGAEGGWPTAAFPYACPSPDAATSFFGLSYMPLNAGDLVVQDTASS
jgi:hypothetical protein